jgi:hypothetical protein
MKRCPKCNTKKEINCFPKSGGRGDGYGAYCKECQRKLGRENYRKHKERYFLVAKERDKKIDELIFSYKNRPCKDCGKSYPHYVMDFDHLGEKFGFNISFPSIETIIDKSRVEN